MRVTFSLLYSLLAYTLGVAILLYFIGFSGGLLVPVTVDSGASASLAEALIIDTLLLSLFAVQHSVMARPAFKRWWAQVVPPPVERSTFLLATSAVLAVLFWQWRPIATPVVWQIGSSTAVGLLWAMFFLGWVVTLVSTFLLNHFELFGLQQAFARVTGRTMPAPQFRTPLFYRYVRHPLYLGIVLSLWSVPVMTAGHLLFSTVLTGYVLLGIWFEERDLVAQFGERYRRYREEVGMLVPWRRQVKAVPPGLASSSSPGRRAN